MALKPTRISLHRDAAVGTVDPCLFGGFLEHMGRAVYGGIYEPTSRHADADGFRTDVLAALAELRFTALRYPGGNFVSGYDWRDGVGPRAARPVHYDRAWRSRDANAIGTDEFLGLAARMGWTPMLAVNLGDGLPAAARDLVEYCNGPSDSAEGGHRARNGRTDPWGVPLWCLGNEMDGWWQIGHVKAPVYVERAREAWRLMRDVDPSIETVACGSSDPNMPTYPKWDRTVLEAMTGEADYLSLHRYARNFLRDTRTFLGFGLSVDRQIEEVDRLCLEAQQRVGNERRMYLSFDEWNVWYRRMWPVGWGRHAPRLLEETYNLEDALVVAGFLNSFIRHADVVKIATLAQIVNVIAPIVTRGDDLLRQSIFHAFRMFSSRRDGVSLRVRADGPSYPNRRYGQVPFLDASAILGADRLHLFVVNRSVDSAAPVQLEFGGGNLAGVVDAELLTGPAPRACNTFAAPEVVAARPFAGLRLSAGSAEAVLPPLSLLAASVALAGQS